MTMPQLDSLDHFVLTVTDIATTCRFYQDVLGMKPFTCGEGYTALAFGNSKINLRQTDKEQPPHALHPTPGSAELCFVIRESLLDFIHHLEAQHIPVEEGPVRRTGATGPMLSVYFRDPDGNLIEIATYAEA